MVATPTTITKGVGTNATSFVTSSVTLTIGRLYLLTVNSRTAASDPNQPTISGATLTTITSDNYDNSGSQKRVTLFRAVPGSIVTGALTIDFAGQTQTDCEWILDEIASGFDTSGTNGSGAIAQAVVNQDVTGTGTTLSVTLGTFGNVNNATYAGCAVGNSAVTFTPSTGMSAITTENPVANICTLSEFKNSNNTTPGFTSSIAGELGILAIEIKATPSQLPKYDHVITILMENSDFGEVIGNMSDCPYINNTLLPLGSLLTNYSALSHPSLPNYLALISGSQQSVTTDFNIGPPDNHALISATNIIDSLVNAGLSWKAYMEAMPSTWYTSGTRTMGDTGTTSNDSNLEYQEHHNPFVYFTTNNNSNANSRLTSIVPYSQFATDLAVSGGGGVPQYAFITPQIDHDMHDTQAGGINRYKGGDNWCATEIGAILASDAYLKQKTMIILVWDESDATSPNTPPCLIIGPGIRKNYRTNIAYNHYNTLRTVEEALGLPTLTANDAGVTIISDIFIPVYTPGNKAPQPNIRNSILMI